MSLNEPFIMVFTEENRDALIAQGFTLLFGDGIYYLFENDETLTIDLPESEYTTTCIMSFIGQDHIS